MLKKSLMDSWSFFKIHLLAISIIILPIVVPIDVLSALYQYFIASEEFLFSEQLIPMTVGFAAYPIYAVGVVFYIASVISVTDSDNFVVRQENYVENENRPDDVYITTISSMEKDSCITIEKCKLFLKGNPIDFIHLANNILISKITGADIFGLMKCDKKNKNGEITLILTKGIGKAFVSNNVDKEVLKAFLISKFG